MIRKYDGKDLLKVLIFYGIVNDDLPTSEFSIVCPFHDDVNPSMRVNLSDGTFFCFGCGVFGNAYDFVKKAQPELSDLQVAICLEKIIKSDEVKKIKATYKKKKRIASRYAIDKADDYYYGLKEIDWHSATEEEKEAVLYYMQERGFTAKDLNMFGCRLSYNVSYPIIFPILDNGEFKGWVSRTTNKRVEQRRKYLYNEGFHKRTTICGNYKTKQIIFICEGFLDRLNLMSKGHIKNVVALLGWHLSDEQLKKLQQKQITTVVSVLDNDAAGEKGTVLLQKYFNVIRFPFPEGVKDVGEMTESQIKKALKEVKYAVKNIHKSKN